MSALPGWSMPGPAGPASSRAWHLTTRFRYRYLPAETEAMAGGPPVRSRACLLAAKERTSDDSASPRLGIAPSEGA